MSKIRLKNILGKKNDTSGIVSLLIKQLDAVIRIEDEDGKILLESF